MAFGRRRQADEQVAKDAEDLAPAVEEAEAEAADPAEGGPWDSTESYPEIQRLDFGALQVPVASGLGFQVNFEATEVDEEGNPVNGRPVAVLVQHGESAMQLQVFAAPKRSGIWDDVRRETAKDIEEQAQGQTQEGEGPFGPELIAMVPAALTEDVLAEMPAEVREQIPAEFVEQGWAPQVVRFLGVDGPRWFLQVVVQGAAIEDEEQWQVLEDVLRGVVIHRGDQPMPPRDLLELRIPKEFNEAGEQDGEGGEQTFDPFERGPEITEVH
ncbi:hypothetical protein BTM25_50790 [Actinomadura rubteroloni]|uniref:DUF3710 domain-containing protein n=1 Tax=Actinomadura rubteroloni TaxID=1926885 RepID=A0A2P4UCU6_9ACTN|nr:DUF3710 domain-containing protein [Actinomadura rubteroloni]POM22873.1 hypothetical protein BTM25_50790 [Actinomadura rubteroloni]